MMTLNQVKALSYGDYIKHEHYINADGSYTCIKVSGRPKTWKRNPERVQVPVKIGFWQYGYITEHDLDHVSNCEWYE